ncbi:hypothetical protein ACFXHA_29700 [Nocardia sp. NPDC059240]|uniref:hypothetical protein n=1 Tax=Nocardia sp. NPDC059240 TaxID=3346786 RepID=UPI003680A786
MSDREVPGRGRLPGPGGDRFDAVEQLRRKLESLKAGETKAPESEDGPSNLTRMPRRPRRMSEEVSEPPRKTFNPEVLSAYDPAPTRPVMRSELQRETGWWPVDPGQAGFPAPPPDPNAPGQDGSVIDLGEARRKRAADAPAAGIRRIARPRRISSDTGVDPRTEDDKDDDSPPPRH